MPAVVLLKHFDEGANVLQIDDDFSLRQLARFVLEHSAPTIIPWAESESPAVFKVGMQHNLPPLDRFLPRPYSCVANV